MTPRRRRLDRPRRGPSVGHLPGTVRETVLLNLESGVYFGLDAVGTRVWQLLQQDKTIADVCDVMVEEFDVSPEVLREDVSRLVGELRDRGIVTLRDSVEA